MRRVLRWSLWALGLIAALPVALVLLFLAWMWIYYDWHFENAATRAAIYSDAQMLIAQAPQNEPVEPLKRTAEGIPIPQPTEHFLPHFDRA